LYCHAFEARGSVYWHSATSVWLLNLGINLPLRDSLWRAPLVAGAGGSPCAEDQCRVRTVCIIRNTEILAVQIQGLGIRYRGVYKWLVPRRADF
jgi:hypothetical protein